MSAGRQIRRYLPALSAIMALVLLACAVAAYILAHQRIRFPWQDRYAVTIELINAQAVTPGQGQSINVAGVTVGSVEEVRLRDGIAMVRADIDPDRLPRVYADATALVRPKSGLQDMVVEIDPGHPAAGALKDGTIPVSQTLPQVNLDEVLAGLDADSRDYLRLLVSGAARGLEGRGEQLRALLKAGAPTLRLTRRVSSAVANRRGRVRRLVHNLRTLSEATAGRDRELSQLVSASARAFGAVGSEQEALGTGIGRLPSTVRSARRALSAAQPFADELGPTLDALLPAVRHLPAALRETRPLLREGPPQLRDLRRLVEAAVPVVDDLRPTTADLATATPSLTRSFTVLRRVTNELAHNPPGSDEGYLFWLAWFAHNSASLLNGRDAHGIFWRGQAIFSCSTIAALGEQQDNTAPLRLLLDMLPCPKPPPNGGSGNTTPGGGG
ncbi:MAG: MlaD family protein [Solirubrobacteraceae bacterium]